MGANCLIIAGEKSGEEHALTFFPEIKNELPFVNFWGVGGNELKANGMELLYHLNDFSSMGFSEVISKIPYYIRAQNRILKEVKKRETRVAILIDFQDFNLRLAQRLKKLGVEVLYYVAPQAWAWRSNRAKILSKTVHTLFTIIPFEKKWFNEKGVQNVEAIPHPILTHYKKYLKDIPEKKFLSFYQKKRVNILLLPGSRRMEVTNLLPDFIEAVMKLKEDKELSSQLSFEIGIVCADSVPSHIFDKFKLEEKSIKKFELVEGLLWADFALACSGTVTLTAALFQVPTVVGYKGSFISEFIFHAIVKYYGFISLANIVFSESIFPEIKQNELDSVALSLKLKYWLTHAQDYERIKEKLKLTIEKLEMDNVKVAPYMTKVIREVYRQ